MKYCVTPAETPLRTKKRSSSVGVHPSDTESRSTPSTAPEVERFASGKIPGKLEFQRLCWHAEEVDTLKVSMRKKY